MSEKRSDLLMNLIKKSVGLPTAKSDCCDVPAGAPAAAAVQTDAAEAKAAETNCCGSSQPEPAADDAAQSASSCCGSSAPAESGSCCG